jgi:hypothetical protein
MELIEYRPDRKRHSTREIRNRSCDTFNSHSRRCTQAGYYWYDKPRMKSLEVDTSAMAAQRFRSLANEWQEATRFSSNLNEIAMHPAYQRIIGLGMEAVPLILRDLQQSPNHWFWALNAITGYDPAANEQSIEGAAAKWIEWGRAHGLI